MLQTLHPRARGPKGVQHFISKIGLKTEKPRDMNIRTKKRSLQIHKKKINQSFKNHFST